MIAAFDDNNLMPFGKHKGEKMANVPASYLLWLYDNVKDLHAGVKGYVEKNMEALKAQKRLANKMKYR